MLEGGDAGLADQHGQHPPHGWMVPKLESHVKDTGRCFRDGFQDGILAVLREGQGAARGSEKAREIGITPRQAGTGTGRGGQNDELADFVVPRSDHLRPASAQPRRGLSARWWMPCTPPGASARPIAGGCRAGDPPSRAARDDRMGAVRGRDTRARQSPGRGPHGRQHRLVAWRGRVRRHGREAGAHPVPGGLPAQQARGLPAGGGDHQWLPATTTSAIASAGPAPRGGRGASR